MDFALNDEQKMMIETVRRFIKEELQPLENEVENSGQFEVAKANIVHEKSKALGLFALNIPREFGGGGLSKCRPHFV
jgi:acyl-CoA dehydrogenase